MAKAALTTVDNPFDPFDQFDDWYRFDEDHHYCSSGLLARIALTSDQFSDKENEEQIEKAIDRIILNDPLNIFKKVIYKGPEE